MTWQPDPRFNGWRMNPLTRPPCRPDNHLSLKNKGSTPALMLRSRIFYVPHSVSRAPARLARSMGSVSGIRKDPDALRCVESTPTPFRVALSLGNVRRHHA